MTVRAWKQPWCLPGPLPAFHRRYDLLPDFPTERIGDSLEPFDANFGASGRVMSLYLLFFRPASSNAWMDAGRICG